MDNPGRGAGGRAVELVVAPETVRGREVKRPTACIETSLVSLGREKLWCGLSSPGASVPRVPKQSRAMLPKLPPAESCPGTKQHGSWARGAPPLSPHFHRGAGPSPPERPAAEAPRAEAVSATSRGPGLRHTLTPTRKNTATSPRAGPAPRPLLRTDPRACASQSLLLRRAQPLTRSHAHISPPVSSGRGH